MKNRFVVCVHGPTKEQENKLTNTFKDHPELGYWHWFSDMWLLSDPTNKYTTHTLRDWVKELLPGVYIMVFKVDDGQGWAGYGRPEMFDWMNKTWPD